MPKDTDEPKTTTQLHEGPGGAQVPTTAVVGMPSAAAAAGTTPQPSPPGTPVVGHPQLAQAPTPQQVTPTTSTTDLPMSALTGHDPGAREPNEVPAVSDAKDPAEREREDADAHAKDMAKDRKVRLTLKNGAEHAVTLTGQELKDLRSNWNGTQQQEFRGEKKGGLVWVVPADVVSAEVEG